MVSLKAEYDYYSFIFLLLVLESSKSIVVVNNNIDSNNSMQMTIMTGTSHCLGQAWPTWHLSCMLKSSITTTLLLTCLWWVVQSSRAFKCITCYRCVHMFTCKGLVGCRHMRIGVRLCKCLHVCGLWSFAHIYVLPYCPGGRYPSDSLSPTLLVPAAGLHVCAGGGLPAIGRLCRERGLGFS